MRSGLGRKLFGQTLPVKSLPFFRPGLSRIALA